jgi:hypothetical protein
MTGGCGRVHVKADTIEDYVRRTVVPVADSPAFLDEVFAVESEHAEEARTLVAENSADEHKLTELGDMFGNDEVDRATYTRQSKRLRDRIAERTAQLAGLRGQSALGRYTEWDADAGRYLGTVERSWESMPTEDKRLVLLSVVESISVGKASRPGSNSFDTRRIGIHWNYRNLARLSGNEDDPAWRAEIAAADYMRSRRQSRRR